MAWTKSNPGSGAAATEAKKKEDGLYGANGERKAKLASLGPTSFTTSVCNQSRCRIGCNRPKAQAYACLPISVNVGLLPRQCG